MDASTARLVFAAVVTVMGLIWLLGIRFALSRLRRLRQGSEEDRYGGTRSAEAVFTGEITVQAPREALSKKVAEYLTTASASGFGITVRVTERTSERITFERVAGMHRKGVAPIDGGIITLEQAGGGTRVRYGISLRRFASIMGTVTYLVCFLYGGLFVVGTPVLLWFLVVNNEDPQIRMQTIQTVQMVHGVWPPFLVGGLCSRLSRMARTSFETLLGNLQHTT